MPMMRLSDMLVGGTEDNEPPVLPVEGQIARLIDVRDMVAARWGDRVGLNRNPGLYHDANWRNPYKFGDFVAIAPGGPYATDKSAEIVMVVIDVIHDADRVWTGSDRSKDFGGRVDTRVAICATGDVSLMWFESWGLTPYKAA